VYALRALRAGALGYIMKREGPEAIVEALRKVIRAQISVSSTFGEQLIYKMARVKELGEDSPLDCLSDRELEVLHLVGEGQNTHQIADALHLSVKTIESHRLHIKAKLGLKSAGEMVRFAMDWRRDQSAVN
jgi:DNA-binding NarL/FixJ family response regulator